MRPEITDAPKGNSPSEASRQRMLGDHLEPLFYADWVRTAFIHYEVDADDLQRCVPFPIELYEGKAYVSLVAFTMQGMRACVGGRLGALIFKPIATHEFLNVRAYVKQGGEPGIYFLSEWLSNPLSVRLGPVAFGLPYRYGQIEYDHRHENRELAGMVVEPNEHGQLDYTGRIDASASFEPCELGSRDEFLMERYTAFTKKGSFRRFFRIWHPPWPQVPMEVMVLNISLLTNRWKWFEKARLVGANYSPGVKEVWMGRPHHL